MLRSMSKSSRRIRPRKSKALPLEVLWRVAVCLPRGAVPCLRPLQGGRLREGGTRACLVVSPALARCRHGRARVVAVVGIVVRARDRNPKGPRPAASGARVRGLSRRQPFCVISVPRGLEPGRGPLGPRGASPMPNELTSRRLRHVGLASRIGGTAHHDYTTRKTLFQNVVSRSWSTGSCVREV